MRTEDGYFVHRCLSGETESFAFLVDKYRESVFSFAYTKLRNFDDAEDVTQEVFLKAFEKLHTLRRWENFAIWLHTITNNLCINLLKSSARHYEHVTADQNISVIDEAESRNEDSRLELLDRALDNLPEMYRQVLTLYYLGDMNSEEISRFLGISPSAIRQRLSRARSELREEIFMIMGKTFGQYRLRAGFTFRIMEMVKHVRVKPISITKGLSLGLSVATGFVALFFGIGQHLIPINPLEFLPISTSSGETSVLETGEYPVDVLKVSNTSVLSNNLGNGYGLGSEIPSLQNALFMSPQAGDKWTRKADMPTARSYLSSSVVDGKIYVIGGYTDKDILSTVEEYDPVADKWTKKANMPTARCGLATSVVNGKIYAIGGFSINGPVTAIEEYDPAKDKWTWKANMSGHRTYLSSSVVNGKIYIIGGYFLGNPLSTVEEYDPTVDKCIKKTNMPTPRGWLSTSAVNGKVYAIGGSDQLDVAFPTVEEYDPMSDKWTKKANMPKGKTNLSTSVVNGKIYAIGEEPEVYEYDPLIDTWSTKANIPTARNFVSTSAVNEKIYVFGGTEMGNFPNPLSTVEEYDTGFAGEGVNFKGKLLTTWGEMRTAMKR
jgi:RNA polymerase sigma factor (sigma-70 family)